MGSLRLIDKVMRVSPSIRIATICNTNGKIIHTARRKVIKNRLSRSESRAALASAVRAWKVRNATSRKIGKGKYVIAEYEKVKRITLPVGRNLLYVTTSPNADHNRIIRRLRQLKA